MLSVFLFTLLCVCVLPATSFATESYDLWIYGTHITSDNADDVLNNGAASYNAKTNTLTLNNANLTQIRNNTGKAFKINVSGNSTVPTTTESPSFLNDNL